MITVFYDGKCGLCSREIRHYQNIAPHGIFDWVDITVTPALFTALGLSVSEGLKALHVMDNNGVLHVGIDAFIVIWKGLSTRWRILSYLVGLPLVRPLVQRLYIRFANWRFKRLGYDKCGL